MKNLKYIAEIDRYLKGDLSESDMIDLEVRMLEDRDLRREFTTLRILVQGVKESAKNSTLQEKLHHLHRSLSPLKRLRASKNGARVISLPTQSRSWPYLMGVAILLVLIMVIAFPMWQHPTPAQMFATHFEISPNLDYRTARGHTPDQTIAQAYQAYDRHQFSRAAMLLKDLIATDENRLVHLFYLGNCHLALGEWDQAIEVLEEPAYANFHLTEDAKWYLGLAYLGSGDTDNAIPLLKESTRMLDREKKARKMLRTLSE